jgi:hypothetical protein
MASASADPAVMGSVVWRLRSTLPNGSEARAPPLREDVCGRTGAGRMISYEPSVHPMTSGSRSEPSAPPTIVLMISPRL